MSTLEKGFHPERQEFDGLFNCIMFALGNKSSHEIFCDLIKKDKLFPTEAFEKTLQELDINFKKLPSFDDSVMLASNEYVVCLYWWTDFDDTFGCHSPYTEYHVVRRQPDNKWLHKSGFFNPISEFPSYELEEVMLLKDKAFFVLTA